MNRILRPMNLYKFHHFRDNLYFDTSGVHHPALLSKAVEVYGANRIVFGSDRPFHAISSMLNAISSNILHVLRRDHWQRSCFAYQSMMKLRKSKDVWIALSGSQIE